MVSSDGHACRRCIKEFGPALIQALSQGDYEIRLRGTDTVIRFVRARIVQWSDWVALETPGGRCVQVKMTAVASVVAVA